MLQPNDTAIQLLEIVWCLLGQGVCLFYKGYTQNNRKLLAFCLHCCAYFWDLEVGFAGEMSVF